MKILGQRAMFFLAGILIFITAPCGAGIMNADKVETVYRMYKDYKKDFVSVKDIYPLEAMRLSKTGDILFVDVRSPAEIRVSKLPNAITVEEFLKNLSLYKDATIVAYCTISYRSGVFAKEMEKEGIRVNNLAGGLLAWVLEGGKVFDNHGETKRIHVYDPKWNYLPNGYESVEFSFLLKFLQFS
jgi:sodium/bile acid cotransporter 7